MHSSIISNGLKYFTHFNEYNSGLATVTYMCMHRVFNVDNTQFFARKKKMIKSTNRIDRINWT